MEAIIASGQRHPAAKAGSQLLRLLLSRNQQRTFEAMQVVLVVVTGMPRLWIRSLQVEPFGALFTIAKMKMIHDANGFNGKNGHGFRVANFDQIVAVLLFGVKIEIARTAIN